MVDITYLGCVRCGFKSHQRYYILYKFSGSLMVKQLSDKQKIAGSSPVRRSRVIFSVSSMVEQLPSEQKVKGSSPLLSRFSIV